ncbi:BbrUII/HgiDII family restriction enzyme [Paenibacillus sp. y28]|uniref:BbrUII/HgiDII family restriction enzyme n=1 Tax=Paenibacillus sp. y28 TaxID=3129110 RepID=UPI003019F5A8
MSKYIITMDLQVLNHLGLNLYSNMPAVISEVVANAWDADAENVDIEIEGNSQITIIDDGCGMSIDDINSRFLKVGYRKRNERSRTPKHNRPFMGRKGIGKLSLFSIAHEITILSYKNGEKNALQINTNKLSEAIRDNKEYHPDPLSPNDVDFSSNGTKIILRQLKKRTLNLGKYLKRRLARRFSIIGDEYKFNIKINNEPLKLEDREYLSKAEYLWIYGVDKKEKILSETSKNVLISNFERNNIWVHNETNYKLTGWIATSVEPNALKDEDETINRIAVMIRGKMAKEDILSEFSQTGLYAKYVFGELHVEFLDTDEEDDITTSNRQNIFEDDERYIALKEFVREELRHIKNEWIGLRNARGTENAVKIEVIKEWYDELGPDDKKIAKKFFGKINQLTLETSEEQEELIRHGVLAFETLKLKNSLSEFEQISVEDISAFIKAANTLNSIEATFYYKIVYERLAIIKKMKEVVSENALEKVIQEHLAQNLWLLDPSWDRGTEIPAVEEAIKTQFDIVNDSLTQNEKDARLDVRYKKASNKHLIIELKRAGRQVRSLELTEQIRKYHSAMNKVLNEGNHKEPFEIIVLLGKQLDGENVHSDTYEVTLKSFQLYNTRIMYYAELIANAEKMYSEFIEKNKEAAKLFDKFIKSSHKQE